MSGIAGIYNLDGRPVDRALLGHMTESLAHRGPDAAGLWVDGAIGLGHRMLWTTPEALQEKQPFYDESRQLCLVFDGRVDNREELIAKLEAKGARLRYGTDAELILEAYALWGVECPFYILGDFAFAVWDQRKHSLYCARDILGVKPFNYFHDAAVFLFTSELHALLLHPNVGRVPNEGMVGEYLVDQITSLEETLFEGILRLPPGHWMRVRDGRVEKHRYWDIDPRNEIRYKRDKEYADHFLDIFRESIRCRLRSHGPVGSHLSGGLDSSSVSVTAQALLRESGRESELETYSLIFPGMPCDESLYIRQIVDFAGLKSNLFPPRPVDQAYWISQARHYQDFPGYPNGVSQVAPIREAAKSNGVRIMLTGLGGNQWLQGNAYQFADLLRELRIISLSRQSAAYCLSCGFSSRLSLIWNYGFKPIAPEFVKRFARRIRNSKGPSFSHVSPEFVRNVNLVPRLSRVAHRRFSTYAKDYNYRSSFSGRDAHYMEMNERGASAFAIEERHPFFDRRLVEFTFAIPDAQLWQGDTVKYVLVQAMKEHLPRSVLHRRIQSEFTPVFLKAFTQAGCERILESSALRDLGWTHESVLLDELRSLAGKDNDRGFVWWIWLACGLDFWYRAVFLRDARETRPNTRNVRNAVA